MHDKALALPKLTNQRGMRASDLQRDKMAVQKHQVYLQKRKLAARWRADKSTTSAFNLSSASFVVYSSISDFFRGSGSDPADPVTAEAI